MSGTPSTRPYGNPTEGLPDDLLRVLRDQSIVVPQDGGVFKLMIAEWQNAPSNTASAELNDEPDV